MVCFVHERGRPEMPAQAMIAVPVHETPEPARGLRVIVCVAFNRDAPPDKVSALKQTVQACPSVLHTVEVTGTFDFIMELTVPDVATFNARLEFVASSVASLVDRYEVNFVSTRFIRKKVVEGAIWVQCENGMRRVDATVIDKVEAEGDYMRVHSNGDSWLVHSTLRAILDRLDAKAFIQIHRSLVVRGDFIERLIHEDGRWVARLHDGTRQRVAKSHVAETLKHVQAH